MTPKETKSMIISKEEFQRYGNNVVSAFIALQTKMKALLRSADCGDLRNTCICSSNT